MKQALLRKPKVSRHKSLLPSNATADAAADGMATPLLLNPHLTKLEDQLETLKAQVRQAQQLAGLGTAAAMIAHEVNNLLTPLLSYARLALDSEDKALTRKTLEVTLKNVHTLVQMSERVLGISAARVRSCEAVVVGDAAREAAEALCRELSKDGIRFTVDAETDAVVKADPLQIRQVLFNLFLNARQAMAASHSGRLSVSARRQGDTVEIVVSDNGPGISPEVQARMFEPLQSTKTPKSGGTARCSGLGLSLCRDLVRENDGTLTVESMDGAGTTFHIRLPAYPASPDSPR